MWRTIIPHLPHLYCYYKEITYQKCNVISLVTLMMMIRRSIMTALEGSTLLYGADHPLPHRSRKRSAMSWPHDELDDSGPLLQSAVSQRGHRPVWPAPPRQRVEVEVEVQPQPPQTSTVELPPGG